MLVVEALKVVVHTYLCCHCFGDDSRPVRVDFQPSMNLLKLLGVEILLHLAIMFLLLLLLDDSSVGDAIQRILSAVGAAVVVVAAHADKNNSQIHLAHYMSKLIAILHVIAAVAGWERGVGEVEHAAGSGSGRPCAPSERRATFQLLPCSRRWKVL